jgi:hypothetical protein
LTRRGTPTMRRCRSRPSTKRRSDMPDEEMGNEFGLKCPECGNTDDLNVECRAWVTVIGEHVLDPYERSNFAYEPFSGWHWESGDEAQCPTCGHKATVGRFQGR